ncbi:hypothetical protein BU23DRAFT_570566 [Bimuria novae-zelandiae CBS 107.79]|uniref:Uncharacterized protein n=1 Tax=Bimuria novae-zelandiae CBS 107.79 TaxID=1447943 RepID=A0A6A5V316_9PLEO|nr:hypothetical protein BU23DRAFT_570566 [Bimuria novae-zelandiae CBS 107.79]
MVNSGRLLYNCYRSGSETCSNNELSLFVESSATEADGLETCVLVSFGGRKSAGMPLLTYVKQAACASGDRRSTPPARRDQRRAFAKLNGLTPQSYQHYVFLNAPPAAATLMKRKPLNAGDIVQQKLRPEESRKAILELRPVPHCAMQLIQASPRILELLRLGQELA